MKYRYVMIQKKIKEGDRNAQILIEDPDKPIGKKRIENEIEQGGNIVGWIDTDCPKNIHPARYEIFGNEKSR